MPDWISSTPWWVAAGLIVSIGYAIVRFTRWTGRVDARLDTLTDTLEKGLAEVRADIKKILDRPVSRDTVKASSPITLTEFGEEISSTVSAR